MRCAEISIRTETCGGYLPLMALIALESRDLVRAAALAWITFLLEARSSLLTSVPNVSSLLAASLAAIDSRTLRVRLRIAVLVERFFARRPTFCRKRFLALGVLGMGEKSQWSVVSCPLSVATCGRALTGNSNQQRTTDHGQNPNHTLSRNWASLSSRSATSR